MTENKRFKLSEPNGAYLIENEKPICHWIDDDEKIIDLLNEQHEQIQSIKSICRDHKDYAEDVTADCVRLEDENEALKEQIVFIENTIRESYYNERTSIGKNTLKQLAERLEVIL